MKMNYISLFCLLPLVLVDASEKKDYHGYMVFRMVPQTVTDVLELNSLNQLHDVWKDCHIVSQPCDVMVQPEMQDDFEDKLKGLGIDYSVMIEDLGILLDEEEKSRHRHQSDEDFDYGTYHTLSEIEEWMVDIENQYPDLITSFQIATSYEGREIRAFKISSGGENKPAIWFDGAIHAREWVSPAMVLYFVHELASQYGVDPEVTGILDDADIYVLPVFNVDGYEYTWTTDRMWRKTRSFHPDYPSCFGCDPNRNWDIRWNEVGSSNNPCSDLYAGQSAFSEDEVRMVAEFVATVHNVKAFLDYHSYGQMYMTPYGYTSELPIDFDDLMSACEKGNAALYAVHGMEYRCGTLNSLVGPNSGSSADYAYEVLNIKYSFGVELRDRGQNGFLLPEEQIIPTCEENWAFFKVFARLVIDDV